MRHAMITVAALALMAGPSAAHDMGKMHGSPSGSTYLYGYNRLAKAHNANCCLFQGPQGQAGDCKVYPLSGFRLEGDKFILSDGEVIPQAEASISPDDQAYRCKYDGQPTHCFFFPAPTN
jgi:hypothetical protein